MTVFTLLVTFNHKINLPYRWYIVMLAFMWPIVLFIMLSFTVRLVIGIIKLYYAYYAKRFQTNWQNLK